MSLKAGSSCCDTDLSLNLSFMGEEVVKATPLEKEHLNLIDMAGFKINELEENASETDPYKELEKHSEFLCGCSLRLSNGYTSSQRGVEKLLQQQGQEQDPFWFR
ncbi:unnamed protein product [Caretta caretta]